jgi:hypothetical protein
MRAAMRSDHMIRLACAAIPLVLAAQAAAALEPAGSLTLTIDGQERPFVLVQGADGANPGSRYSRLGQDVVMTIVGVLGDEAREPEDAEAVVEIRFTVDQTGPEVRTGSVLSYSTSDAEGKPTTRGGTVEIAIEELDAKEDGVVASGAFTASLPPDHESPAAEVEGTFRTAMKSRDALDP